LAYDTCFWKVISHVPTNELKAVTEANRNLFLLWSLLTLVACAYGMMLSCNGEITAVNNPDAGMTFNLVFPVADS
jgi:hypothetical protein